MKLSLLCTCWLLLLPFTPGCNRIQSLSFVPVLEGYAESPANTLLLKKGLREISGIRYFQANELIGINDEEGIVFYIDTRTGKFRRQPFGKKGDYEDLVITPAAFYVLKSNGNIHEIDPASGKEKAVYQRGFPKYMEFESLCYDAPRNRLLLICKICGKDEPFVNAWEFDCGSKSFSPNPVLTIPWTAIRKMGKDDTIDFHPSSAAIHPLNGKLYIISSLGKKILVTCNLNGELQSVHQINPDQFQQPEGICFAPNGDMYVSNEGRQSKASILYFPYQPKP